MKAVITRSFERIHRSNLVGMGVLPLQFKGNDSVQSLGITGEETYDISGLENGIKPMQDVTLTITRKDGSKQDVTVLLRIDTPIEVDYYQHGGILPFVLRQLLAAEPGPRAGIKSPRNREVPGFLITGPCLGGVSSLADQLNAAVLRAAGLGVVGGHRRQRGHAARRQARGWNLVAGFQRLDHGVGALLRQVQVAGQRALVVVWPTT